MSTLNEDLTYIQWFITNVNDILFVNLYPPDHHLHNNNDNIHSNSNMVPLPKIQVDILSKTNKNISYTILERTNAIPSCNPVFSLANADNNLWMNSLNYIDDFSRNIRINIINMNKYNDNENENEIESLIKSWEINLDTIILIGSPSIALSDLGDLPLNSIFFTSERGQILTIQSQLDFMKKSLSSSSSSEMKPNSPNRLKSKQKLVGTSNNSESKKILSFILENEKTLKSILEEVNTSGRSSSNVCDMYDDEGNLLLLILKQQRDKIREEVEELRETIQKKMQEEDEEEEQKEKEDVVKVIEDSEGMDKVSELTSKLSLSNRQAELEIAEGEATGTERTESQSELELELELESKPETESRSRGETTASAEENEMKIKKGEEKVAISKKNYQNDNDNEDDSISGGNNSFLQRQAYLDHLRASVKRESALEKNDINGLKAVEERLDWWSNQLKKASSQCGEIAKEVVTSKEKSKVAKLDFMRIEFLLEARRLKLLNSLQVIYPIEELDTVMETLKGKSPHLATVLLHDRLSQASLRGSNTSQIDDRNSSSSSGVGLFTEYTIRGVHIPCQYSLYTSTSGANTTAADEDRISTALGYLAHFVLLLAKYTGIALRYPVYVQGSRSFIGDPSLPSNQGLLPLFRKGSIRITDKAAVWLLRDVEQIIRSTGGAPYLVETKGPLGSLHEWMLDNLYPEIEI